MAACFFEPSHWPDFACQLAAALFDALWPTEGEYKVVGSPALALCILAGNV